MSSTSQSQSSSGRPRTWRKFCEVLGSILSDYGVDFEDYGFDEDEYDENIVLNMATKYGVKGDITENLRLFVDTIIENGRYVDDLIDDITETLVFFKENGADIPKATKAVLDFSDADPESMSFGEYVENFHVRAMVIDVLGPYMKLNKRSWGLIQPKYWEDFEPEFLEKKSNYVRACKQFLKSLSKYLKGFTTPRTENWIRVEEAEVAAKHLKKVAPTLPKHIQDKIATHGLSDRQQRTYVQRQSRR